MELLHSPSSTTFTEHVTTPTKIDTCQQIFRFSISTITNKFSEPEEENRFDFGLTLVAPASRLLKRSSSTTLVMSNMMIPDRMERRTPSGKGLIVFIFSLAPSLSHSLTGMVPSTVETGGKSRNWGFRSSKRLRFACVNISSFGF